MRHDSFQVGKDGCFKQEVSNSKTFFNFVTHLCSITKICGDAGHFTSFLRILRKGREALSEGPTKVRPAGRMRPTESLCAARGAFWKIII